MMLLVIGVPPCFIVLTELGRVAGESIIYCMLVFTSILPPLTLINSLMLIFHAYRLFSCGTGKEGDSFLVEWNESEGAIKRTYSGFRKKSAGVVQFDTTQNHFLAVGEDSQIKFWDMDNINILTTIDADGGLPVSAYVSSIVII